MKITKIIIDETIYPRSNLDHETVARYREALEAGATLPPLVVMPDGRLLDGRHRYEACKQTGMEEVEVVIEEPEDPDARAVELNLRHGRPLTREELRQAARRWYGKKPVTEIAKTLGVTRQTVQNWVADLAAERGEAREEIREKALEMRAEGMTQEEIAERLGVTQQVVSKWEYNSVKNLTPLYEKISNNQPMEDGSVDAGSNEIATPDKTCETVKNLTPSHENISNSYLNDLGREIFVSKGLWGSEYETFWRSPTGGLHRVKSPAMPMVSTREEAQKNLDEWAEKKGLQPLSSGVIISTSGPPIEKHQGTEIVERAIQPEHLGSAHQDIDDAECSLEDYGGREKAQAFRKKHLEYSDQVKAFFSQIKKASEIAEQLVSEREELYKSITEMKDDGMSITVLASAVVQACDIYIPRITAARDMLSELLKPGIKGVVSKDKFLVVKGGRRDGC